VRLALVRLALVRLALVPPVPVPWEQPGGLPALGPQ
jgi:hypothetical protein